MPTQIPIGSPLAAKLYSRAAFAATQNTPGFRRNLTGPAPTQSDAEAKLRDQTNADMPFVRVTDLGKGGGDQVSVDLYNIIRGKPSMGDSKLAGKMMNLTFSSMDVRIDQYRGGVDTGGRMAQQRTTHQLRSIAKANIAGWSGRLENQLCLVHVAGSRGADNGADWVVPLESDPDFTSIAVNPVLPPTRNRRYLAGDATGVGDLATTDYLTLDEIDRMRAEIDDMVFPPQPVRLDGDPAADENPLYVWYVTGRQWHYLQTATGDRDWRSFLAAAHERSQGFNHPLFLGTPGMWNGMLIKKMPRGIRFPAGFGVREYDADNTTISTNAANVATDRSIILGAQALAEVYGKHGRSGHHAHWHEELTDHENTLEVSVAFMGGKSKIRFVDMDNVPTDHGVITFDSYAPAPSA